jgi:hypothetical protein
VSWKLLKSMVLVALGFVALSLAFDHPFEASRVAREAVFAEIGFLLAYFTTRKAKA